MKKKILLSLLVGVIAGAGAAPQTLLHLSFEDEQWVEFSQNGAEVYADYPNLTTGVVSNGASITQRGEFGTIDAAGNINKAQGTISFWYKPDASTDFANEEYGFFSNGTWTKGARNYMVIWSWAFTGGRIRMDVDSKAGAYAVASTSGLTIGQWSHLAFTWDHTSGIWIYLNGNLIGQRSITWSLADYPEMKIGQMLSTGRGTPHANGVMDEFKIYDSALTAAEVLQDYNGTLNAPNAPQVIPPEVESPKKRTLKISFDTDFDADEADGNSVVQLNSGVTLSAGFKGQGASFGSSSLLQYAAGSNMLHTAGTMSFWMKTDWEPAGNGFPIGNNINARGVERRLFIAGSGADRLEAKMQNFLNLYWDGGSIWNGVNRQVMKDTWHHYVFTWDTTTRKADLYLDGKNLGVSGSMKVLENPFSQLEFGRNWGSISGVLDEISVYNWPLNHGEVLALYSEEMGLSADLLDYAVFSGQNNSLRLQFSNNGTNAVSNQSYTVDILQANGPVVFSTVQSISVAAGTNNTISIPLNNPSDGLYRVNLTTQGSQVRSFELLAITEADLHPTKSIVEPGAGGNKTLLQTIDCTQTIATDKYRDDGAVSVVDSPIGSYREAQNIPTSGFAYKIDPLSNPGQPHWLEITYPDNADRTFMVAIFQEFNGHIDAKGLDTIGVITGVDHPLTGKMQTKRLLFWPDTPDIVVGCYAFRTYAGQAGPALATIKIYEATGLLPERRVANLAGAPSREIGVWQEDPSMTAYGWFNQDRIHPNVTLGDFWKNKWSRIVDYLDYSGQNLWHMMLTDYDGDNGLNSNQIATGRRLSENGRVPGWADLGALMLESKGFSFYASINNRISFSGTKGSFYKMIPADYLRTTDSMQELLEGSTNDPIRKLIVDCIASDDYYTGSYNPLNPIVQAAYGRQVRAYAQRYGKYANFGGVHFLGINQSSLFFGSLEEGYSDINIEQFEQDTGINVPETTERRRFSARRDWLFANAKSQWINWRCQKIRTFYKSLAAIIREYNPNAKLVISLRLSEAFVFVNQTWPTGIEQLAQYWRESGIDFDLFSNDSDIVLMQAITPHRGRVYGGATQRYDGFNPETSALVANHAQRSAFISYHSNLEFLPNNTQRIPDYWTPFGSWGGTVNGPIHAFANVVPSQEFILEYMTDILAHNDAKRIIHGWWGCPDNGNIDEFSRFYAGYRSIPAYDFLDLPGADDPVKVRYCNVGGTAYIYFVNQQPYPIDCTLHMQGSLALAATLDGTAYGDTPIGDGEYEVAVPLEPYQVLCLSGIGSIAPTGFEAVIPLQNSAEIRKAIHNLSLQIENTTAVGVELGRIMATYQRIMEAYAAGRYAEVQHLMQSFPVYNNPAVPPLPTTATPRLYRILN